MDTILLVVAGFVAAVVIFLVFVEMRFRPARRALQARRERKEEQDKWRRQAEADRARWAEEECDWNRRVREVAVKFLSGVEDWHDPKGKEEFVRELWGDKIPQYLWYEFDGLSAEETAEVFKIFWPTGRPSFGDLEGHRNLRIRNAEVFIVDVYLSTGTVLVLDQVGYAGYGKFTDEPFPTNCVSFSQLEVYGKPEGESELELDLDSPEPLRGTVVSRQVVPPGASPEE